MLILCELINLPDLGTSVFNYNCKLAWLINTTNIEPLVSLKVLTTALTNLQVRPPSLPEDVHQFLNCPLFLYVYLVAGMRA